MMWSDRPETDEDIRRTRIAYLLTKPLSDKPLPMYSQEQYNALEQAEWTSMSPSPLGGCINVKHAREAEQTVDFTWGLAPEPNVPLPPGIVAELCFDVEMYSEYAKLIMANDIAYDHIIRLVGFSTRISASRIGDAQSFAMASRAKKQALCILKEICDS